ncbi:MAG TPA: hypothetical protein PK990_08100 [Salinivirgaceae bacterium]|nr:hypothetical protein [Salinivirgaceae bacterium]
MQTKPLILCILVLSTLNSQINAQPDSVQIQKVIDTFIDGLNTADTVSIRKCIDPNLGLLTVFSDGKKNIIAAELPEMFLSSVARRSRHQYREEQYGCHIDTDGIIASVWCNYVFYDNNKIAHCGVNAYQLYKIRKGWKIIQITDSRKSFDCIPPIKETNNE